MRITIIGCGHVGLVTGICLASLDHRVSCLDQDADLVALLQQGRLPIYEPHLDALFDRHRSSGLLTFTREMAQAVNEADVLFLCVGAAQLENGESDFSSLDSAARQLAQAADSSKLIVIRTTVPVQTGEQLKHLLRVYRGSSDVSFTVASNPQFLREGTAVDDFFHSGRLLFGVEDSSSEQTLREIYRPLLERSFSCPIHAEKCPSSSAPQLHVTGMASAELIKQTSNAYLAIKISYANMLSDLCERLGADVQEVTHAVGLDPRIGSLFLTPGIGFGGSRLPADLRAFCRLADRLEVEAGMAHAAERVNRKRVDTFFEKVARSLWVLKNKRIALLGLTHKAGTDDISGSPALELYQRFVAAGASVRAFDPQAVQRARTVYPNLICASNAYDAAEQCDALVISTDWHEFRALDWRRVRALMARPVLFDGRNILSPPEMRALGFEYHSVGRPL